MVGKIIFKKKKKPKTLTPLLNDGYWEALCCGFFFVTVDGEQQEQNARVCVVPLILQSQLQALPGKHTHI